MSLQTVCSFVLLVGLLLSLMIRWSNQKNIPSRPRHQLAKKPAKREGITERIVYRVSNTILADLTEPDLACIESVDFDWKLKSEIPYRPWHDGPYNVTMG